MIFSIKDTSFFEKWAPIFCIFKFSSVNKANTLGGNPENDITKIIIEKLDKLISVTEKKGQKKRMEKLRKKVKKIYKFAKKNRYS